jgi:hypothetical protein
MKYAQLNILFFLTKIRNSYVKYPAIFLLIFAIYSCSSLKNIEIELAVTPLYPIEDNIQSLGILNRSMNMQFSNLKSDSIERILVKKKMVLDTVFQDSIVADTVIQAAAKALYESGRFDVVIPKVRNIARPDNEKISSPLNLGFIKTICSDFNVDAVLILESFEEHINTQYYYTDYAYAGGSSEYNSTTDIDFISEWRLYRPDEQKPAIRFQVADTIFWKANSESLTDLYSQMPKTKEALISGGIAAGLQMAAYISPGWVSQTRHYFLTGVNEIDAAVSLIKENKWVEAATIWTKYATVNSAKVRSKVEFNLALASEMNGELNLAIEWGLKSFKSRYSKTTEIYLKTLDAIRKAKQKEVKQRY